MRPLVLNIVLATVVVMPLLSQERYRYEKPIATPLRIVSLPDSMIHSFNEDSLIAKTLYTRDTLIRPQRSTTIAMLASMIPPGGLGQIYNGAYWKVPIIWGVQYYFVSVYRQQNDLYQRYHTEYLASIDSTGVGRLDIKDLRDFYKGQRDTFGWYIAIAYVINILDAYVDASLYSFEVSPNLQPSGEVRASMRIPF